MKAQYVRERLKNFITQCGFKCETQKSDKRSQYYELRPKGKLEMMVIRVSNHCANSLNWKIDMEAIRHH